jgi:hypothetical protein
MDDLDKRLAAASLVESLKSMEQTWITNRLSWLFTSQSFCILAYVQLIRNDAGGGPLKWKYLCLMYFLPLFGVVCCVFVIISILAANRVTYALINQRAKLTQQINEALELKIPRIGHGVVNRDEEILWTEKWGALPFHLPWVLLAFWLVVMFV